MSLPVGHTARPMRLDDAALIAERSAAYTSALLGFPKHSPEDVANYLPEGVVVRRGAPDETSRRAAHAVLMEAFEEQPGTLPRPFEDWAASRESRSTFDWSHVTIVELGGQPAGMTECNHNFVSTDNCGYVGRLAVVPSARGRGLAKFLLRNAFAVDAAAGRTGTILHVDTSNPTPAVGLYSGVGLRPDLISDVWMRTITI